jgi:hypothetical protein
MSSPLDPPRPVPPELRPTISSPLGVDDLRIAPSTAELRTIAQVLDHDRLAGQTLVTMRDGSPWIELDVVVPLHEDGRAWAASVLGRDVELAPGGIYRFAIWRYTAKAYRCNEHGAVDDDPIELG